MIWLIPGLTIAHGLAAAILLGLSLYSALQWRQPMARVLAAFFFLAAWWALFATLISLTPDLSTKILLNRLKMLSPVWIAQSILLLSISIHSSLRIPQWLWLLICLIPGVSTYLLLSPHHEMIIANYHLLSMEGTQVLAYDNGSWFHFNAAQARFLVLVSLLILLHAGQSLLRPQRMKIWLVAVSILMPLIADTVAVHYWSELRYAQIVPTMFAFSSWVLMIGVFKHHVLAVVPYARGLAVDSIPEPVMIFDEKNRLLEYNKAAADFFQLQGSFLEKDVTQAFAHRPEFFGVYKNILKNQGSSYEWNTYKDEEPIYFQILHKTIYNHQKVKLGALFLLRDVTINRIIEKELRQLNETKSKFIGILAHDLIGNMRSLSLLTKELSQSHSDMPAEDLKSSLELLQNSSEELNSFINDLLKWAKIQLNLFSLKKQLVTCEHIYRETLDYLQSQTLERNVDIHLNLDCETVSADPQMLKTILRNLISNAIRHSPEGGQILLKAEVKEEWIEFSVEDQGPGLKPEQLESIFHIKEHRDSTGLGLVLCKDFVELHKGYISVENLQPQGCRFFFRLPHLTTDNF